MPDTYVPTKIALPARLIRALDPIGPGVETLRARALAVIGDDDLVATQGDPYIGGFILSSSAVDTYFTRMDPDTTLRNFAEDGTGTPEGGGFSILDSHDGSRNGFGRAIHGVNTGDDKDRVAVFYYILPGIRTMGGMTTDDYVANIRAGNMRDVSVGFYRATPDAKIECSICGREIYSWDCPHMLGYTYQSEDYTNGEVTERVAIGTVIEHHASEGSYVYKGANPDSEHLTLHPPEAKVRMLADAGTLTAKEAVSYERRYGFQLPTGVVRSLHDTYPVAKPTTDTRQPMTWSTPIKTLFEAVSGKAATDDELKGDPDTAFRALVTTPDNVISLEEHKRLLAERDDNLKTVTTDLETLSTKIDELTPLAENGRAFHKDLVDRVIHEEIRGLSDAEKPGFDEELLRETYANMSVEGLKKLEGIRKAAADRRYPTTRVSRSNADLYALEPSKDPVKEGDVPHRAASHRA